MSFNDNNIWVYSSYDQLFITVINNILEIHSNISMRVIIDSSDCVNSMGFTEHYAPFNKAFNKIIVTNLCNEILCYDYTHTVEDTVKKNQCCICMDNQATHIYIKCLHVCVCNDCYIKSNSKKCPICKTHSVAKKIYYPCMRV